MANTQGFDDLWEKALKKYFESTDRTDAEKALLKKLKSPDDLETQLETDHSKFGRFREKHGKLTAKLKAAAKPFTVLSSVASSALSLSPFAPASAVLGAVVFLVKAADGVSDAYDWIDQLFDKLRDFTVRLGEYCKGDINEHLGANVAQVLECLLEILARSEKTIKDDRWKKYAAMVFLGKDEEIKASFDKLAKLFESEHRLVSAITFATNQKMDKTIEEIEKAAKRTEIGVNVIQQGQLRDKILKWISSTNFPAQQSDFIACREEGTGERFLDDPRFENWIRGSKTLFCPGMPGAGKTMMAAIAIDHLSRKIQNEKIAVAYIYCSYKVRVDHHATSVLAAILRQLVQAQPAIPEPISRMHKHYSTRGTRPSAEEIYSALQSVLRYYSSVYLVVDALDECLDDNATRPLLLAKIRDLQRGADVDLRLMVTSRHIPEILEEFKHAPSLDVRASDEDVKKFIAGHMDRLPNVVRRNEELKDLVQNEIAQAADGMFLLARLYVNSLLDKTTKAKVKLALQKISKANNKEPRKLYDEAYSEALERIEGQLPGNVKTAKKVLSWITYAERQLDTRELCHALAVELGELDEDNFSDGKDTAAICAGLVVEELDEDNIPDVEDIVSVCAGLVTVDEESNIIRLVHYTTQEYFERTREHWFPCSQLKIASTCLIYLSFNTFKSGSCPGDKEFEGRLEQNVFLDYASRYWGQHVRTVQEQVSELASFFLISCVSAYRYWAYSQNSPNLLTGLHLTAIFGLLYLSEMLLSQSDGNIGISVNSKDVYGRTPLSFAAEHGHEAVIKLLLARDGVDPDSKDEDGQTPLLWAAEYGHEAVVKLLLARDGVDPDSKDKARQTPLWCAVKRGHEAVVKLLLARDGVDPDSKDNLYGQTPLSWAAEHGHKAVVKLLLARDGVDPDSKDVYGQTPLWCAAKRGHEAVVKLLLARDGVDPDSKHDMYGQTPLSWAAEHGHEAVVKLLLARDGVDPDSKDEAGRTPLSRAAEHGHEAVVKLLLARDGLNPDSKDDMYGQTPLSWAAEHGHEAVVKLLLARDGLDPDSKGKDGQTPLSRAAEYGHKAVVKLLLARDGVDPGSKGKDGQTPLSRVAEQGHEAVVKLLLARDGVDPDSKDEAGQTPLSRAAKKGHEAVVKLLLARDGVDPGSKDEAGQTPLSRAAEHGHKAVVKLLLARDGVDPDSKNEDGQTPLSWAAEYGHEAVVKLLLARDGIDPDSKDKARQTPLWLAAGNGHEAVIKLLLARDGVDPDSKDEDGQTPLSWAAEYGHEAVVKLLLARDGIDPGSKDKAGQTPLSWAAENGHEAVVKLLKLH